MDANLEKQLRKAAFIIMARQLEVITGRAVVSISEICELLKVTRPTAKAFMVNLIDSGKASGLIDKKGKLLIIVNHGQWTTKELERARLAYDNLIFELFN